MKTDNNASAQREYDVIIIGGGATGAEQPATAHCVGLVYCCWSASISLREPQAGTMDCFIAEPAMP